MPAWRKRSRPSKIGAVIRPYASRQGGQADQLPPKTQNLRMGVVHATSFSASFSEPPAQTFATRAQVAATLLVSRPPLRLTPSASLKHNHRVRRYV